jgi:hypothetical protein
VLIELTDIDGRLVLIPASRVVTVTQVTTSYHGVRSVLEVEGRSYPLEVRQTAEEVRVALVAAQSSKGTE